MIIGITGGSGSGKTTALRVLEEMGALCLDADAIYHELLKTDAALLASIAAAFPGTVENGELQRKKLGAVVFRDPEKLKLLNAITAPAVIRELKARMTGGLTAIDAIGLEGELSALCDHTVAVIAPRESRIARLTARDGITREYAESRIDAQKSDAEFSAACEFTLWNGGTEPQFRRKCETFFRILCGMPETENIQEGKR